MLRRCYLTIRAGFCFSLLCLKRQAIVLPFALYAIHSAGIASASVLYAITYIMPFYV